METSLARPQDLPPKGGYGPVQFKRIKVQSLFRGRSLVGMYIASQIIGGYGFFLNMKLVKKREVELRSAAFALAPFILAERDRHFLKQLRRNREKERELMKDYDGWIVGTYFGEPIFESFKEDDLIEPRFQEFVFFSEPWEKVMWTQKKEMI